jgi:hypothetical protein
MRSAVAAVLVAGLAVLGAWAADADGLLPEPEGPVILTVTGAIEGTNGADIARFDRAMLKALDWREVETFTTWTEGPQTYAGPTLLSLLDRVGARGDTLRAVALNDYEVLIPRSDAAKHGVILAIEHEGRPMRVRNRGPVFVIYPMDESEVADAPFDPKMVWQLETIEIR